MDNIDCIEAENQQCYQWRGVESLPLVMAERAIGVPLTKIAKKFGVSRQAIHYTIAKSKAPATDQDHTGRVSDVENRQGDDTP